MSIVVVIMIVWTALAAGVANAQGVRPEATVTSAVVSVQPHPGAPAERR